MASCPRLVFIFLSICCSFFYAFTCSVTGGGDGRLRHRAEDSRSMFGHYGKESPGEQGRSPGVLGPDRRRGFYDRPSVTTVAVSRRRTRCILSVDLIGATFTHSFSFAKN